MNKQIYLDTFFNKNYNKFYNMARNIFKGDEFLDILHDSIIAVYEIPDEKLERLINDKVLDYYIFGIITNKRAANFNSKKSYELDFDYSDNETFLDKEDELKERLLNENYDFYIYKRILEDLSDRRCWFRNRIFLDKATKYKSFGEFSRATNISKDTLYYNYQKTLQKIKNKYGEEK